MLSAISSTVTFIVQKSAGAVLPEELLSLKLRVANALVSYISYLGKLFWPSNLAVIYPLPETLPLYQVLGACAALLCLTSIAILAWKKFPYIAVGWLWYLGTLVPVIGLVQVGLQKMADRYMYIPAIGIFILVAWGTDDIVERWRHRKIIIGVFSVLLLLPLMICTRFQVGWWKDSLSVFSHAIAVTQNNYIAHFTMGRPLRLQGKVDQAIYHYVKALQMKPDYKSAYCGLGIALTQKGDIENAIHHYNTALRLDPNYGVPHYNLARIYDNRGDTELSIFHYEKVLQIRPEMTVALYNLSWILSTEENEKYRNGQKAVVLAEKLCRLTNYRQPLGFDALAAAYAETGRFREAVSFAQKGIDLALRIGPPELLMGLEKRMKLYRAGLPYRRMQKAGDRWQRADDGGQITDNGKG